MRDDHRSRGAPHPASRFRQIDDWGEDPWALREDVEARRKERHARWRKSLSERDWRRLQAFAAQSGSGGAPAALADLDAPIRAGAYHPSLARNLNGQPFGTIGDHVLLAFPRSARPAERR